MKIGIILASFGTSYKDTREKTLEVLRDEIAQTYPEADVFEVYTSAMVRQSILKEEGITYLGIDDQLEQMKGKYDHVYVQPVHIIPGHEYQKLVRAVTLAEANKDFEVIRLGHPLLVGMANYQKVIAFLLEKTSELEPGQALLYMSHGTDDASFVAYPALAYMLDDAPIFVSSVEGYPDLEMSVRHMKQAGYDTIELYPFMFVAGDHAHNDMASKDSDAWQGTLEAEGFKVTSHIIGLGEYPEIRQIYKDSLASLMEEV
ncbi:sirohydrochlorin cobaltochelatase [Suicoccus acidiformans]|uniref:Sirohydrochlorin cobaltochelatase n=1 Tax=Suicoccus acidiformans TaxID=2036206 RepID=A0A347WM11_9LACT|nr:sirohydrochlorin cobaltochelatase [Suicoccus acidiformans]AXY26118.1 sirohydrochlorin cobaltochelatase [Suicoccus acidiformans]